MEFFTGVVENFLRKAVDARGASGNANRRERVFNSRPSEEGLEFCII